MIHTVKIDDSTPKTKKLISELRKCRKGVEFDNPAISGNIPEGYMTSEEFRKGVKEDLRKLYKEHGLL